MKSTVIITLFFLLFSLNLDANPGSFETGKTGVIVPSKSEDVGLEQESVTIIIDQLSSHYYEAEFNCMFRLKNYSKKKIDMLIGFPVIYGIRSSAYGSESKETRFLTDFTILCDNHKIDYSVLVNKPDSPLTGEINYDELFLFHLLFTAGEEKELFIQYAIPYSTGIAGSSSINYIVTTASTWKSPVKKARFIIDPRCPIKIYDDGLIKFSEKGIVKKNFAIDKIFDVEFFDFKPAREMEFFFYGEVEEKKSNIPLTPTVEIITALENHTSFYSFFTIFDYVHTLKKEINDKKEQFSDMLSGFAEWKLKDPATTFSQFNTIFSIVDNKDVEFRISPDALEIGRKQFTEKKMDKEGMDRERVDTYSALLKANMGNKDYLITGLLLATLTKMSEWTNQKNQVVTDYFKTLIKKILNTDPVDMMLLKEVQPYFMQCYPEYIDHMFSLIDEYTEELWRKKNIKISEKLSACLILVRQHINYTMDSSVLYRDPDLLRIAYYSLGNQYFDKEVTKAINSYKEALTYSWSNKNRMTDPDGLLKSGLDKWKHENEQDAPCYYIAYNTACAYSKIIDGRNSLKWLTVALRMNNKLCSLAQKDADMTFVRENYKTEFDTIIAAESGKKKKIPCLREPLNYRQK